MVHELQQAVEASVKEELRAKCVDLVRRIGSAIRERKNWAKIREQQVAELEDARSAIFTAFDAADEFAIEQARQRVHEIIGRGCKAATAKPNKTTPFNERFNDEEY